MSDKSYTPGPWKQGYTITTPTTERWTQEQWLENDAKERRMVFAFFSAADRGRGRVRVAVCERPEDAKLIAAAPKLLEALKAIMECPYAGVLPSNVFDPAFQALKEATE